MATSYENKVNTVSTIKYRKMRQYKVMSTGKINHTIGACMGCAKTFTLIIQFVIYHFSDITIKITRNDDSNIGRNIRGFCAEKFP